MIVQTGSSGLSDDKRREIGKYLDSLGAKEPCPRCRHSLFFVVDNVDLPLAPTYIGPSILPNALPTVLTACANCGFVALHALGLLPQRQV